MAVHLGIHADRLAGVRALRSGKGRREQRRFAFEGTTLLEEARRSGFPVDELYCTAAGYDASPLVRELDTSGIPVFIVDEGRAARLSDLRTPSGVLAIAPIRLDPIETLLARGNLALVLADVNDPANAGSLLRSADAFGCSGVVFGRLGVDPYHPKVVRGSMGAAFRLAIAVADPPEVTVAAARANFRLVGLAARAACLSAGQFERPLVIVVGNERHGLGRWETLCERVVAIPMVGPSESLSAAVAGSIALYEASRSLPCQESTPRAKSQDYRH
jgi:TrmH family RNA methyltransferase